MFRTRFVSIFRINTQNCKGSHQCVSMRVGWSGPIPSGMCTLNLGSVALCVLNATAHRLPTHHNNRIPYAVNISVSRSWWWAKYCPKHVELILQINKSLLHLVGSSILLVLYLIDDARSNKNQVSFQTLGNCNPATQRHIPDANSHRSVNAVHFENRSTNTYSGLVRNAELTDVTTGDI